MLPKTCEDIGLHGGYWKHRVHHTGGQRIRRDGSRTVRLVGVGDVCQFVHKDNVIVAGTRSVELAPALSYCRIQV